MLYLYLLLLYLIIFFVFLLVFLILYVIIFILLYVINIFGFDHGVFVLFFIFVIWIILGLRSSLRCCLVSFIVRFVCFLSIFGFVTVGSCLIICFGSMRLGSQSFCRRFLLVSFVYDYHILNAIVFALTLVLAF